MATFNSYSNSVAIIEHDIHEDVLVVWTYPGMTAEVQNLCVKRCAQEGKSSPFIFFKLKNDWIYILTFPVPDSVDTVVLHSSICIVTNTFNPEKYNAQLECMRRGYSDGVALDPTKALEVYLSVHTTGKFKNYDGENYPDETACSHNSILKDLFLLFGAEFVILWNAVLLKKRVLVYSGSFVFIVAFLWSPPSPSLHEFMLKF